MTRYVASILVSDQGSIRAKNMAVSERSLCTYASKSSALGPFKSSGKESTGVFGYIAGIDANPVTSLYFCNPRDFWPD